jgi:hypothetical protein
MRQKVERKRKHGLIRISISNLTPQTINKKEHTGLSSWNCQNNLPLGVETRF